MENSSYYTFHFELQRRSQMDKSFLPVERQQHHFPSIDEAFLCLFTKPLNLFDRRCVLNDKLKYLALRAYVTAPSEDRHIAELRLGYADRGVGEGIQPHFVIEKRRSVVLNDQTTAFLARHGVKDIDSHKILLGHYRDDGSLVDYHHAGEKMEMEVLKAMPSGYFQLEVITSKEPPPGYEPAPGELTYTYYHSRDARECFYHLCQLDVSAFNAASEAAKQTGNLLRAALTGPSFPTVPMVEARYVQQAEHRSDRFGDAVFLWVHPDYAAGQPKEIPELSGLPSVGNNMLLLAAQQKGGAGLVEAKEFRDLKVKLEWDLSVVHVKRLNTGRPAEDPGAQRKKGPHP